MDPRQVLSDSPGALLRIRAAVWLPTLVAVLSVVTGVANISAAITGPLSAYVSPAVQRAAGFTGALTGFLMLLSAGGMRRRLRVAWIATVVLLPVTALQGLVQSSDVSLPLVALSLLSLPTVLVNYDRFDRPLDLTTTQLSAAAALVGALVYGTAGTFALREQFDGVSTLLDAFYFTVVTASTVGYGEITPVHPQGQSARLFTLSVVVIGTTSFALGLGSLLGPAIEARLSQALGTMNDTDLELLEDHVVVLGYGDLTEPLLEELAAAADFVVVTPDSDQAVALRNRDVDVVTGDPSDEAPQQQAGVEHARAVVAATNDDAQDALAILTARELNPGVRIVAGATDRENTRKLRRAGADAVISPAVIGGHLLVASALDEADAEAVARRILGSDGDE
ncbi:MAG: NAD-binding protein [Haloarculaceae archaeon]